MRRLAQISAVLVAIVATISASDACTIDGSTASTSVDSGLDPSTTGTGVCPPTQPVVGAICLLPEGTTCAFACGSSIVECLRGVWQAAGNPPPTPPCPEQPPTPQTDCPPCWPATAICHYNPTDAGEVCRSPDKMAAASCDGGKWNLSFKACADAGEDADASTNVQGDADADAD